MKKIFFSLAMTLASYCSYAQTNTFPGSGNVGIGTTSPATTLYVQNASTNYSSTLVLKNSSNTAASRAGLVMENDAGNQTMFYKQASGASDANDVILYSAQGDTRVYTGGAERFRISNSGYVGIGTSSPTAGLDVWNGAVHVAGGYNANYSIDGAYLSWNISGGGGETNFVNNIGLGWMGGFTFDNTTRNNVITRLMTILGDGNVGIGTSSPDAKLAVNGTIHSKEVKVDLTGWPDYVFKPKYRLPALNEVKGYIEQNQHLPDMPSEAEVIKNGINLGKMNAILLKKVEELTLYLIEKDKQVAEQQKATRSQQEQINVLKSQIAQLIKQK